jgi:hypothetical protein
MILYISCNQHGCKRRLQEQVKPGYNLTAILAAWNWEKAEGLGYRCPEHGRLQNAPCVNGGQGRINF